MKFWRNSSAVALIGALSAGSALAGMQPAAPAAAAPSHACIRETNLTRLDSLAMPLCMNDDTQSSFGNGFPWENSTFFFSTFRNQYLYPSDTVTEMLAVANTIETIGARSVTFAGSSTNVYASFANGDPSEVTVTDAVADSLVSTFALNTGSTSRAQLLGTDAAPIVIGNRTGARGGSLISSCNSCPGATPIERDAWVGFYNLETGIGGNGNFLVDHVAAVGVGNSGAGVWDMSHSGFGQGCPGPQRAFGSGSFANPNHLTTALGVDEAAFVWVFVGLAPPPPATVQHQISEIIRLLLTPQGLRCSWLDLSPGNGRVDDDPFTFPDGKDIDPISPQVSDTHGDGFKTGDELLDGLRNCGWNCP